MNSSVARETWGDSSRDGTMWIFAVNIWSLVFAGEASGHGIKASDPMSEGCGEQVVLEGSCIGRDDMEI